MAEQRWPIVVGVLETEPPRLPWRPLLVVRAQEGAADHHLWTYAEEDGPLGTRLPAAVFEARAEEGLVRRLPEPVRLEADQALVRLDDGAFAARGRAMLAAARTSYRDRCIYDALQAYAQGCPEEAADWLYQARLADPWTPIATVLLAGLAADHRGAAWADEAAAEIAGEGPHLELDGVRDLFAWARLPDGALRERWYHAAVRLLGEACSPLSLVELRPVADEDRRRAVTLLLARQLPRRRVPVLGTLRHADLRALAEARPEVIERVLGAVQRAMGKPSGEDTLRALEGLLDGSEQVSVSTRRAVLDTKVRGGSWVRHAATAARLEETLGTPTRRLAWKRAANLLGTVRSLPGCAPWQAGESAAAQVRQHWDLAEEAIISSVVKWSRRDVGLALFPAELPAAAFEACHVVSTSAPPASYLDVHRAIGTCARVRFAAAKAVGFQVFLRREPGAHFSHMPREDGSAVKAKEPEMAANAFAAYFIAPRHLVAATTRPDPLSTRAGYGDGVRELMRRFGLSYSAAFSHLANCHGQTPRFEWFSELRGQGEGEEHSLSWAGDEIPVPSVPDGLGLPLERADGFSTLMARSVDRGELSFRAAGDLLGLSEEKARQWLSSLP